jgi:hypothetical protein
LNFDYFKDNVRVAQNTPIGLLVCRPFSVKINDVIFNLQPPESLIKTNEVNSIEAKSKQDLEEIRELVSKLYLHLNVEQFETEKEEKILKDLEMLRIELEPMEKV